MSMARAFVALVPPRAVLDAVGKLSSSAKRQPADVGLPVLGGARWATRAQWHLTLQFLGNRVDLDAVAAALATVRGASARVQLGSIGGFPSERRATVLWVGVIEGAEAVTAVATAVGEALTPVVGAPDDRPFHAHLTLARLARPADVRAAAAVAAGSPVGPAWEADRLTLFESVTAPTGAAVPAPCPRGPARRLRPGRRSAESCAIAVDLPHRRRPVPPPSTEHQARRRSRRPRWGCVFVQLASLIVSTPRRAA